MSSPCCATGPSGACRKGQIPVAAGLIFAGAQDPVALGGLLALRRHAVEAELERLAAERERGMREGYLRPSVFRCKLPHSAAASCVRRPSWPGTRSGTRCYARGVRGRSLAATVNGRLPAALRQPSFVRLWAGSIVSSVGTQMSNVARLWVLYLLTHSAFALGLEGLCFSVPILVLPLVAGPITDRVDRRTVLKFTMAAEVTEAGAWPRWLWRAPGIRGSST